MAWWEHVFKMFFLLKKVVSFAVVSIDKEGVSLCQFNSLPFIRVCLVSVRDIDFIFVGVLGLMVSSWVLLVSLLLTFGAVLTSRDESRDPDAVEEFCLFLSFFSFFWLFPLAEGVSYGFFCGFLIGSEYQPCLQVFWCGLCQSWTGKTRPFLVF